MKEFGQLIPELPVSVPVTKGVELVRVKPLTQKEMVDVTAGALCRCASCQRTAEPTLVRNPLLRGLDRGKASIIWGVLKQEDRKRKGMILK